MASQDENVLLSSAEPAHGAANVSREPVAHFMADDHRERISAMAHAIWESEGCPDGRAEQHWLRAERLVETEWLVEHSGEKKANAPGELPVS